MSLGINTDNHISLIAERILTVLLDTSHTIQYEPIKAIKNENAIILMYLAINFNNQRLGQRNVLFNKPYLYLVLQTYISFLI